MSSPRNNLERRLQLSGILLVSGLLIEAVCLLWARPLAFIFLVSLGGGFVAAGIVIYLYSLVSVEQAGQAERAGGAPQAGKISC